MLPTAIPTGHKAGEKLGHSFNPAKRLIESDLDYGRYVEKPQLPAAGPYRFMPVLLQRSKTTSRRT